MNKRGLEETSPDHYNSPKRGPTELQIEMATTSVISVDKMREILAENNLRLVSELVSKADFQLLYADLSTLRANQEEISAKVTYLENRNRLLESQMERLMQKSVEDNVVVHMTPEQNIDPVEKAKTICAGLLDANETSACIESAHRVNGRDAPTAVIIVKLKSRLTALNVLRNGKKLKGTKISIHKDLPYSARQRRGKLVSIMKVLRESKPNMKIFVRDDRMYVEDTAFTWDTSQGLICGNNNDSLAVIRQLIGEIPSSLINLLKKLQLEQVNNNKEMSPSEFDRNDSKQKTRDVYSTGAAVQMHGGTSMLPHVESSN